MKATERAQHEPVLFERTIPSTLDERRPLIDAALETLERAGFSVDRFFDRLILDELVTNAILHGKGDGSGEPVSVTLARCGATWSVEVVDRGEGFDWRRQLDILEAEPDPWSSEGRGLRLLRSLGVRIEFHDDGRRVSAVRPTALNLCSPA